MSPNTMVLTVNTSAIEVGPKCLGAGELSRVVARLFVYSLASPVQGCDCVDDCVMRTIQSEAV